MNRSWKSFFSVDSQPFRKKKRECKAYFKKLILDRLPAKAWIAGGALRDFFIDAREQTKDLDIFFSSLKDFEAAKKWLVAHKAKKLANKNLTTELFAFEKKKLELVKSTFESPDATINAFDFTVCCCAVDKKKVYHVDTFWHDIKTRSLVIHNPYFLYSTMYRVKKHLEKGFEIDRSDLDKLNQRLKEISSFMKHEYFRARERAGLPKSHLLLRVVRRFPCPPDEYHPKDCEVVFYDGDTGSPHEDTAFSSWIYDKYEPISKSVFLASLL